MLFRSLFLQYNRNKFYKLVSVLTVIIVMLSSTLLISNKTISLKIPIILIGVNDILGSDFDLGEPNLPDDLIPLEPGLPNDETPINRDVSDNLRFELLNLGFQVFLKNPLVGVTSNNIGYHAAEFVNPDLVVEKDNPILNNPHNIIVQTLASSGIIGFTILSRSEERRVGKQCI